MAIATGLSKTSPPRASRGQHPGIALTVIAATQLMVVLDATIVNIALPHIQDALKFSTTDLAWVVNAYTLTFGGLLLLGGRAGDILGRRRVFVFGVVLFSVASLLGGFAQSGEWLLLTRALQGVGGAICSPTAFALIATNFEEGPERNRAFGVFSAVAGSGAAIGLLAGGMLTSWLSWRWVLFVNVPIGIAIALAAPKYVNESERHPGRFDLVGAVTSTLGLAALVYGFIRVAGDTDWTNTWTLASFGAAVLLLAAFVVTERRSAQPITPLRMFASRNRSGGYVMMLCLAAAMFGIFFYLTIFVQRTLGFSALKAGVAFLPVSATIIVAAQISSRLHARTGPKPFMAGGAALVAIGMTWITQTTASSGYVDGVLLPTMIFGLGMGFIFVPLMLMAVAGVGSHETGAATGLLNATQQIGGALGLSILTTVFGTATRDDARTQVASFLHSATPRQLVQFKRTRMLPRPWSDHILAHGISQAFVVAAALAVVALLVALFVIRARPSDRPKEQVPGGLG